MLLMLWGFSGDQSPPRNSQPRGGSATSWRLWGVQLTPCQPQASGNRVGGGEELGPEEWISYLLLFFLLLIIMENLTHTKVARTVVMNSKVSITTQLLVHGQSCFLFPSTPHLPLQIISKHVPGTISFYS